MAEIDPNPPVTFLQTRQSAKSRFCKLEIYEAAVCDFTLWPRNNESKELAIARLVELTRVPAY
jgi:hypothetical protein